MEEKDINEFLLQVEHFPKSKENCYVKVFNSKEEYLKNIQFKELNLILGISNKDYEVLNKIFVDLEQVFFLLKTGKNLELALATYTIIENKIEKEISSNLYLFARQSIISIKAFYYYKLKDWNKAYAITLECIAINDYLFQRGIYSLAPRLFEQNRNLCSILLKEQKTTKAQNLFYDLFNYLFTGVNKGLHGNSFRYKSLWKKTKTYREGFIYEMFTLTVADFVRFNFYSAELYLPSKWYLDLKFKPFNENSQIIHDWIHINKELRKNNCVEFLKSLTLFLNQPISSHYDILKISLIIELIKKIKSKNCISKELLFNQISSYLNEKLLSYDRMREIMIKKLNRQTLIKS